MHLFTDYINKIQDDNQRAKMEEIINWIEKEFPELGEKIAWNKPMFTHHETFILAISEAKKHISISPEPAGMMRFSEEIKKTGYEQTKNMFYIPWEEKVDYSLLKEIIEYNIQDKLECTTFFRN